MMAEQHILAAKLVCFFVIVSLTADVVSLPFAVFHGLSNSCDDLGPQQEEFIKILERGSGNRGLCIEIGNGQADSIFMPLIKQVAIACQEVKKLDELRDGYNVVGLSQGNMVVRGLIELCDDAPPVKNFISLGGPHAGLAGPPGCTDNFLCEIFAPVLFMLPIFSDCMQNHFAATNYLKVPTKMDAYLKGNKFLPLINNEIANSRNATYRKRLTTLHNLVLVKFENDTILVPKETAWFGFYPDGSKDEVLPVNETALYKEDWIGLKTLDEAGNVTFVNAPAGHCHFTRFALKTILKFLKDD